MLFMLNESIKFNDGNGESDEAIYLGSSIEQGILKHKIERSNRMVYFVDREHLYSLNLPDVSSVPVSTEQYAAQLPNLSQEQLNQISNPSVLDNDKR